MGETLRSLWSPTEPHGASKEPYIRDPMEPCIRRPTGPTEPYGALHMGPGQKSGQFYQQVTYWEAALLKGPNSRKKAAKGPSGPGRHSCYIV